MRNGRIELSLTQVIAGVLATITAAVLASFLGVAGTMIGAAIASGATTVGGAVYNYSLRRTTDRLRNTTAARWAGAHSHDPEGEPSQSQAEIPPEIPPEVPPEVPPPSDEENDREDGILARIFLRRGSGDGDEAVGPPRLRWLVVAGAAVGIFAIAIGAITGVEAIAGKPVASVVWQKPGSGTTVGGVVEGTSGPGASPRPASPAPATSPTSSPAQPSGTPSSSGPQASPTPTGTPGSPGPSSPSPGPSGPSSAQPTAPSTS